MDVLGTLVMVVATTTLIIGFTWLGDKTKLTSGAILLLISLVAWVAFIQIERRAAAPILDPQVLFNRTFMTVSGSGFLSFFGMVAVVGYSPIFVQEVMQVSPTISGSMLTPYTTLSAFVGIPAGFLLAKTKKYRGMYNFSYLAMMLALFGMWRLTAQTPIWVYVLVTSVIGFGLGILFTLNTLVAQFSVPRELLGVAIGAIFFFQMIGIAVAPAILGLAQNSAPDLESGLKLVFLMGALASVIALLLIVTIPEIEMDESDE
jgi:sugar phosphate permease